MKTNIGLSNNWGGVVYLFLFDRIEAELQLLLLSYHYYYFLVFFDNLYVTRMYVSSASPRSDNLTFCSRNRGG